LIFDNTLNHHRHHQIMRLSEAAAFGLAWTAVVLQQAIVAGATSNHHLRSLFGRIVGVRYFVFLLFHNRPPINSQSFSLHLYLRSQGTPAAVGEFPYFATYGDYDKDSFCGGVLIYADIILSA
jgi:hypothetical protein